MENWQQMIEALESAGMKRREIAERCDIAYSTLCELARGEIREPTGMRAVRLHELYSSRIKPATEKAAA